MLLKPLSAGRFVLFCRNESKAKFPVVTRRFEREFSGQGVSLDPAARNEKVNLARLRIGPPSSGEAGETPRVIGVFQTHSIHPEKAIDNSSSFPIRLPFTFCKTTRQPLDGIHLGVEVTPHLFGAYCEVEHEKAQKLHFGVHQRYFQKLRLTAGAAGRESSIQVVGDKVRCGQPQNPHQA